MPTPAETLKSAADQAHDALTDFEATLRKIADADLHRADPEGGWTVAQVVSHIHLSGLLWIADLERLRHCQDPGMFMFREELGHDVLGAPPPSVSEAADRIASLRTALDACLPGADPAVMDKSVEVPPLRSFATVSRSVPFVVSITSPKGTDSVPVRGTNGPPRVR